MRFQLKIFLFRVKKPDEFNRPRIEPKDRLIPRKKSFSSKKVIQSVLLKVLFIQKLISEQQEEERSHQV